jgi:hypothetical protein
LKIVALARHADGYSADARPRVEPDLKRLEPAIVRRASQTGKAERSDEEPASRVNHPRPG